MQKKKKGGKGFASLACIFEGYWLVVRLNCAPNEKVTYVFVACE